MSKSNPIITMSALLKNVEAFDINRPIGKNYITCKTSELDCCQKVFLQSLGAIEHPLDPEGVRVRYVFPSDIIFDAENLDEH